MLVLCGALFVAAFGTVLLGLRVVLQRLRSRFSRVFGSVCYVMADLKFTRQCV